MLLLSISVSGCAFYQPDPLPLAPELAPTAPALSDHALTLGEVAAQAVLRSPDLAIERRRADVTSAQAFAAGLLPDPQLTASLDHPTVQGLGLVNAYALGLSQDLQALLTEPSRSETAVSRRKQAELDLLWAEWRTIQNALDLYVQKSFADRKVALLQNMTDILNAQSSRSMRALAGHNSTLDVAGADLSAALDISSQKDAAARIALQADADLKLLLNLAPSAKMELSELGEPDRLTKNDIEMALANVSHSRTDLLALQAGYHAQEESVRTAILQQFPTVSVGFTRAADTSNIQTTGLSVTLNIPIFGSTQAKIRTEQATRAQLRAEYLARLDQTETDAWRIWKALGLLRTQQNRLEASLPELRHMAQTGRTAYLAGNLAPATYVLLQTSLSAREGELLDLKATMWTDTIALRTILGIAPVIPAMDLPK